MNLLLIGRPCPIVVAAFAILLIATSPASPQTAPVDSANPWSRGTTLGVLGGVATASPNTTATVGAAVGWELSHFAEIEGAATWLSEHSGAAAFAADLKLLVNLRRPALLVPYVGGGAGMYVGSFDTRRATMPLFYQRRYTGTPAITRASSPIPRS